MSARADERQRGTYAALTQDSSRVSSAATKSCAILKNLFCGVNTSQWTTERKYGIVLAADDNDDVGVYDDEDEEEETIFSHSHYNTSATGDVGAQHSDSGVDDESLDDGTKTHSGRSSLQDKDDAKLLNRSPFAPLPCVTTSVIEKSSDIESDGLARKSSLKSSVAQFFADFFHGSTDTTDEHLQRHSTAATQSMYEIGAYNNYQDTMPSLSYLRSAASVMDSPGIGQTDYYQKLICQLTLSNSNMARQNELLTRRVHELDSLLKDHVQHLNSIYYTLFRNGYSALQFPDGEEVYLSQFRGALLNFLTTKDVTYGVGKPARKHNVPSNIEYSNLSDIASALKERHAEQRNPSTTSVMDASSAIPLSASSVDSSFSSSVPGHYTSAGGSSTSTSSSTSTVSTMAADADELKTAMLKCITRAKYDDIDEFVNWLSHDTLTSTQSYREEQYFFAGRKPVSGVNVVNIKSRSLEDQMETRLKLSSARKPLRRASLIDEAAPTSSTTQTRQQTPRAFSESELRSPIADGIYESNALPSAAVPATTSGMSSARTVKGKAARLRTQSVNGSKIGVLLLSVSSSSNSARRSRNNTIADTPRKSLTPIRSPIMTLGRAPSQKVERNLI